MATNWRGEAAEKCYTCGSTNTKLVDATTRECPNCGEYAVENEGIYRIVDRDVAGNLIRWNDRPHAWTGDDLDEAFRVCLDLSAREMTPGWRVEDHTGCERIEAPRGYPDEAYKVAELHVVVRSLIDLARGSSEPVLRTVVDHLHAEATAGTKHSNHNDETERQAILDACEVLLRFADAKAAKRKAGKS